MNIWWMMMIMTKVHLHPLSAKLLALISASPTVADRLFAIVAIAVACSI
jgi:hypothetical protein